MGYVGEDRTGSVLAARVQLHAALTPGGMSEPDGAAHPCLAIARAARAEAAYLPGPVTGLWAVWAPSLAVPTRRPLEFHR